jgi:hypothetical protein
MCKGISLAAVRGILAIIVSFFLPALAIGQVTPQITQRVDASVRTRISGTVHPLANTQNDRGRADASLAMKDMVLTLHASPTQKAQLKQLADDLHNANSASYHHWLTPAQFGAQYGPADNDVKVASDWLTANGFKIEEISAAKTWIRFSGVAQQVEQAFGTEIHKYSVKGVTHYANATGLSLPTALAPAVSGVVSINNFLKRPQHITPSTVARNEDGKLVRVKDSTTVASTAGVDTTLAAGPAFTSTGSQEENYLAPGDFAKLYNTTSLINAGVNGEGVSIAIVGRSDISLSDVEAFRKLFKLPFNDPKITYATTDPGVISGDDEEAILDVEWSGAVAPKANINFVIGASTLTTDGVDISAAYIVDHALAPIMSISFGECESEIGATEMAFYHDLWQQASVEGITVLVSSGDGGSSGCVIPSEYRASPFGLGVNGLASTPYNVAVGGTELNDVDTNTYWNIANGSNLSSIKGYVPEAVWNESCNVFLPVSATNCYYNPSYESTYAGGGGASSCATTTTDQNGNATCAAGYPKPSWQTGIGVPKDAVRDLPDVALAAAAGHDGFLLCYNGSCQWTTNSDGSLTLTQASVIGGTSAASPSFAGLMALVEQKNGTYQGQANYQLYKIAAQQTLSACNSSAQTNPTQPTSCVFHDVTAGSNAISCPLRDPNCTVSIAGSTVFGDLSGYSATKGYDQASGLGSVDAANLVGAWEKVKLLGSATNLALSKTTFPHGTPVTVTADVQALVGNGTPSGSIVLRSNEQPLLNPEVLTGSTYSGAINSLPGGTYRITAEYGGDATFKGSTSSPVTLTVSPESSTATGTTYTASRFYILGRRPIVEASSAQLANSFYVQFQISGRSGNGVPTGTIALSVGSQLIGKFPLDATGKIYVQCGPYTNCDYGLGTYTFVASYSGDSSFDPSTSSIPFTITKGSLDYSVALNSQTPPPGGEVVATVFFNNDPAVLPTGVVTLTRDDTGATLATGTINKSGTAVIPFLAPAGTYSVLASWKGDANYLPGFLSSYEQIITTSSGTASSSTTLSASASKAAMGQETQFTVHVAATGKTTKLLTGTVTLYSAEGQLAGSMNLVGGQATGFVQWGHVAVEKVYAVYSGDANFSASSSSSFTVTVTRATPTLVLKANASKVVSGAESSLTAILSSALASTNVLAPTGTVQFYDSVNGAAEKAIGKPQALNNGNGGTILATLAPVLQEGRNVITAKYSGDTNWNAVFSISSAVIDVTGVK